MSRENLYGLPDKSFESIYGASTLIYQTEDLIDIVIGQYVKLTITGWDNGIYPAVVDFTCFGKNILADVQSVYGE